MPKQRPHKITDTYALFKLENQSRRLSPGTIGIYRDRLEPFIDWFPTQGASNLIISIEQDEGGK